MIPEEIKKLTEDFFGLCQTAQAPFDLSDWELGGSAAMRAAVGARYNPERDADFFLNIAPGNIANRKAIGDAVLSILCQVYKVQAYLPGYNGPDKGNHALVNLDPQQNGEHYSITLIKNGKPVLDFTIGNRPIYMNLQVAIKVKNESLVFDTTNLSHALGFEKYKQHNEINVYHVNKLIAEANLGHYSSKSALAHILKSCYYAILDGAYFDVDSGRAIANIQHSSGMFDIYKRLYSHDKLEVYQIQTVFDKARDALELDKQQAMQNNFEKREKALKEKLLEKDQIIAATEISHGAALSKLDEARKKSAETNARIKKLEKEIAEVLAKLSETEKSHANIIAEKDAEMTKLYSKNAVQDLVQMSINTKHQEELKTLHDQYKILESAYQDIRNHLIYARLFQYLFEYEYPLKTISKELILKMTHDVETLNQDHVSDNFLILNEAAIHLVPFRENMTYFTELLRGFEAFIPPKHLDKNQHRIQLYLYLTSIHNKVVKPDLPFHQKEKMLDLFIAQTNSLCATRLMQRAHPRTVQNREILSQLASKALPFSAISSSDGLKKHQETRVQGMVLGLRARIIEGAASKNARETVVTKFREISNNPELLQQLQDACHLFPDAANQAVFYANLLATIQAYSDPVSLFFYLNTLIDKHTGFKKTVQERYDLICQNVSLMSQFFELPFIKLHVYNQSSALNHLAALVRHLKQKDSHIQLMTEIDILESYFEDPKTFKGITESINKGKVILPDFKKFLDAHHERCLVYKHNKNTCDLPRYALEKFFYKHESEINQDKYNILIGFYYEKRAQQYIDDVKETWAECFPKNATDIRACIAKFSSKIHAAYPYIDARNTIHDHVKNTMEKFKLKDKSHMEILNHPYIAALSCMFSTEAIELANESGDYQSLIDAARKEFQHTPVFRAQTSESNDDLACLAVLRKMLCDLISMLPLDDSIEMLNGILGAISEEMRQLESVTQAPLGFTPGNPVATLQPAAVGLSAANTNCPRNF